MTHRDRSDEKRVRCHEIDSQGVFKVPEISWHREAVCPGDCSATTGTLTSYSSSTVAMITVGLHVHL